MKGKSKKSMLLISLALILSVALFGTLAYLTSEAKVTNTFTVGDVQLTLDEAKVDLNGKPVQGADRVTGNTYKLIPGKTYVKDPTVTVKAGSEEAYVRMLVTVNCADKLDEIFGALGTSVISIFDGIDEDKWAYAGETRKDNTITYEFRYKTAVSGAAENDVKLDALFDTITVPGLINNDQLKALNDGKFEIVVVAQAIQKEGFDKQDAAWEAFAAQTAYNSKVTTASAVTYKAN